MIKHLLHSIRKHIILLIILLLIGGIGGYWTYKKFGGNGTDIRYISARVVRGALVSSVSGIGYVSVIRQIDVKSKASGDAVYVVVKSGDEVKTGTLLVQLDTRDAEKAVRDAEVNLESAKITLEKLKGPAGLAIPRNKEKAQDDLEKVYEDGFNAVANAFLDFPTIITGLRDMFYTDTISTGYWNIDTYTDDAKAYDERVSGYRESFYTNYLSANASYDKNFDDYKSASRFSEKQTIELLIDETYETAKIIAEEVKSANNFVSFYKDTLTARNKKTSSVANAHLTTLSSYTDKINARLLSLLQARQAIRDSKDAVLDADLDIRSQELAVKQRENSLLDVKEKLEDYFVRAPFAGIVGKIDAKKGDTIGSNAVVATLITSQQTAELSLNEIDAAKIKLRQKATLTFDAIPDLSIAGEVAEIDTIGTVSQGVVSYVVKIFFDIQDERVKPGMSVSADIITDTKSDVLTVPNAAVKSQNGISFIERMSQEDGMPPRRAKVQIGISNDEFTEIVSGLDEGDRIVIGIINPQASANNANNNQQQSPFRIPGLPAGGGGGMRGGPR